MNNKIIIMLFKDEEDLITASTKMFKLTDNNILKKVIIRHNQFTFITNNNDRIQGFIYHNNFYNSGFNSHEIYLDEEIKKDLSKQYNNIYKNVLFDVKLNIKEEKVKQIKNLKKDSIYSIDDYLNQIILP